jgi:hypothetical protein
MRLAGFHRCAEGHGDDLTAFFKGPFDSGKRLAVGSFTVVIEDLADIEPRAGSEAVPGAIAALPVAAGNAGDMCTMPFVIFRGTGPYKRLAMNSPAGKIGMRELKRLL